ncbi:MAG: UPF0280 family protein [Deltaproteobacteria bacterium]|nr:UPF0280 family protein [Deltaproteobacteria bacterium]
MDLKSDIETPGYQERSYRNLLLDEDLVSFQVKVKETDLYIRTTQDLKKSARQSVIRYRYQLEQYMAHHPDFFRSMVPLAVDEFAPPIVKEMIRAAQLAGVGPMAAVAGAMAEYVGRELLQESPQVIVENGGDIFLFSPKEIRVGIFANTSPLNFRVGLRIPAAAQGWGVCTSSGTVGPSISLGRADAVCVVSPSAALADAAATAVGNVVCSSSDLSRGLSKAKTIQGLTGAVIIIGDKLGAWGDVELIKL